MIQLIPAHTLKAVEQSVLSLLEKKIIGIKLSYSKEFKKLRIRIMPRKIPATDIYSLIPVDLDKISTDYLKPLVVDAVKEMTRSST